MYLSGKIETENNIEDMLKELRGFIQVISGKRVDKIDTVAFALYFTLSRIKPDDVEDIDFSDVTFVTDALNKFRIRTKPLIFKTIDEVLQEV